MSDLPKVRVNDKEIIRLLNDGEPITGLPKLGILIHEGTTYMSIPSLLQLMARLSDVAVSDQKQEAYRGLRNYLYEILMQASEGG